MNKERINRARRARHAGKATYERVGRASEYAAVIGMMGFAMFVVGIDQSSITVSVIGVVVIAGSLAVILIRRHYQKTHSKRSESKRDN